jgi:uncharacterized MnhB-related membrane protein
LALPWDLAARLALRDLVTTVAQTFSPRKHRVLATAAFVLLFWIIAVLLVIAAEQLFRQAEPWMSVAAKTIAIVATAFAYMRIAAPGATLDHALGVGAMWLVLVIVVEVAVSMHIGRAWFQLLGSPDSALRNVLLVAWIAAPALFAKYAE